MTLAPAPAYIDVMLASELLEAGRALLNGFVTPERTTLIASTHRIYTVEEKTALGDGRYDSARIMTAAKALAKRAILSDFHKLAADTGAMINAALFGVLPARARCRCRARPARRRYATPARAPRPASGALRWAMPWPRGSLPLPRMRRQGLPCEPACRQIPWPSACARPSPPKSTT